MTRKVLTWDEFDRDVRIMAQKAKSVDVDSIYGVPRGGLCLAVALSHQTGLPLADEPRARSLVVDDIYETGKTLDPFVQRGLATMVWVMKGSSNKVTFGCSVPRTCWVVFPWENVEAATDDEGAYYASRQ